MSGKAREASEQVGVTTNEDIASTGPPAYSLHGYDQLYTGNDVAQSQESHLSSLGIPLDEIASASNPGRSLVPLAEPLSLTMDGELIYPTLPPSSALYYIPQSLTWTGFQISLQRSVPERKKRDGTTVPTEDQDLYQINSIPFSTTVELVPKRASCFGKGIAAMVRSSIFNEHWEVSFHKEVAIRFKKGKWTDAHDKVLATGEKTEKGKDGLGDKQRRNMVIEAGVDPKMMNLLVACWTAKVWREIQDVMTKDQKSNKVKEVIKTGSKL